MLRILLACLSLGQSHPPDNSVDLCKIHSDFCSFKSYTGFADLGPPGALFYWYFEPPNVTDISSLPLILWLQGGPGSSSMLGAFFEHGPVALNSDGQLLPRDPRAAWASYAPVLYVDSPVGTGWSWARENGYAKSQADVAYALARFLDLFAARHGASGKRRLVLAGESYGGHYVPALGNFLVQNQGPFMPPFHLEAVMVGDGLTDPATQVLTKPKEAYAFGLVDEQQLAKAEQLAQAAHDLAMSGRWVEAAEQRYAMEDLVKNASMINPYDVRTTEQYDWQQDRMQKFFGKKSNKDLLHIPENLNFGTDPKVVENLKADVMKSQKAHVEDLLKAGVRVLLYQGQFDWKDGFVSNEAWIRTLSWTGTQQFLASPRKIWRRQSDGEIAGYWKSFENLEQVVVLGAGHLVPMNQPLSAADMMLRFLKLPRRTTLSDHENMIILE